MNLREVLISGKEALADIQKHLNDGDAPPASLEFSHGTGRLQFNLFNELEVVRFIKILKNISSKKYELGFIGQNGSMIYTSIKLRPPKAVEPAGAVKEIKANFKLLNE